MSTAATDVSLSGLGLLAGVLIREGGALLISLLAGRRTQQSAQTTSVVEQLNGYIDLLTAERDRLLERVGLAEHDRDQARAVAERAKGLALHLHRRLAEHQIQVEPWDPDTL